MKIASFPIAVLRPATATLLFPLLTTLMASGQTNTTMAQVHVERAGGAHAPIITMDPATGPDLQAHLFDGKGNRLPEVPANFRRFGEATMGQPPEVHALTLRFAETTMIHELSVTRDFRIEPGGTCAKGNVYRAGDTCSLMVRFTPQGPGQRLGQLTITHSASATPDGLGLGGYGYVPVLSFIPSTIQTVPGTFVSNAGQLNQAHFLSTDGGDRLFAADTNNSRILMYDATGNLTNYSSLFLIPPPLGVTVDTVGNVWYTTTSDSAMREFLQPNLHATYLGGKTDPCTEGNPACSLGGETLTSPGELSADSYGNIFFEENNTGAAMSTVQPSPTLLRLYNIYAPSSDVFATDAYDDLYTFRSSLCEIMAQSLSNAEFYNPSIYRAVAGTSFCGYSGDGGDARNAEISSTVGQFAFDAAGDLYFTDGGNQRVRRIEYNTGIMRTIAGNGTAGYTGDGGSAKSAELQNPTGLAVDSQGQVYVISGDGSGGTTQVIRKITTQGILAFGNQGRSIPSVANILKVTNTGNAPMVLTNFVITGTNPGDFSVDPLTTSCGTAKGDSLSGGATCTIGIIFKPAAVGPRAARINLTNNTVTNLNTVLLNGTGILPQPTLKITSPASGSSVKSGTPITLTASVTSSAGPAPTGQVQFRVDGANFGSPVTIASGTASTSVTGLTTTGHTLGAIYLGDANYAQTGPVSVSITVTAVKVLSVVSLSPVTKAAGSPGPTEFAVSVSGPSSSVPTGEVQLQEAGRVLAAGWLSNGKAMLTPPPLRPGIHALAAYYAGDATHQPALSPTMIQIVTSGGAARGR